MLDVKMADYLHNPDLATNVGGRDSGSGGDGVSRARRSYGGGIGGSGGPIFIYIRKFKASTSKDKPHRSTDRLTDLV